MQAPHRPVPSRATLRALRQLTYVASGTACGAAALVYEERRRRIQFLKQVADNGRVLKEVSCRSRRGHTSLSAYAAALDHHYEGDEHARTSIGADGQKKGAQPDLGRRGYEHGLRYKGEVLPSQVDRLYRRWAAGKGVARQGSTEGRDTRVSETTRNQEGRITAPPSKTGTANTTARQPAGATQTTKPTLAQQHMSRLAEGQDKSWSDTPTEQALGRWQTQLEPYVSHPRAGETCWEALRRACRRTPAPAIADFTTSPESASALAGALIKLDLPPLLAALCKAVRSAGTLQEIVPGILDHLERHASPLNFMQAIDLILSWLSRPGYSEEQEAQWLRLSLIKDNIVPPDVQRTVAASLSNSMSVSQAQTLQDALTEMVGRYVDNDKKELLTRFAKVVPELKAQHDIKADSVMLWLVEALIKHDQRDLAMSVILDSTGSDAMLLPCLDVLWRTASTDTEVLQLYKAFGLSSVTEKSTFSTIINALIEQEDKEALRTELFGRNARIWVGALVSSWTTSAAAKDCVRQFWKVQRLVGDRALTAPLYTAIMDICQQHGLQKDYAAVARIRDALTKTTNLQTILAVLKASNARKWAEVESEIELLKPEKFVAMPIQQRVQMFDRVIRAFASEKQEPQRLLRFGSKLFQHICGETSLAQTLRLLSFSLVRTGCVDALEALHDYAAKALGRPLRLSRIDVADLLRSYYFGFRPSHVGLAATMTKIFEHAWMASSRHWIPLLVISSAYDKKRGHQRQVVQGSHDMSRDVLSKIDDEEFSRTVLAGRRMAGLDNEYVRLQLTSEEDMASAVERDAQETAAEEDEHSLLQVEALDENTAKRAYQGIPADDESMLSVASDSAHFSHQRSKALLHGAQTPQEQEAAAMQILASQKTNPFSPNASTISLGLPNISTLPEDTQSALRQCLQNSGSESCLIELRQLISTIQSPSPKSKPFDGPTIDRLKERITREYMRHERAGATANHSLATALGHLMNTLNQPANCITLLRHALSLPWAHLNPPEPTTWLVLLRAYIALGSLPGVRWVTSQILAHDARIERSLLAVYAQGRVKVLKGRITLRPSSSSSSSSSISSSSSGAAVAAHFAQDLTRQRTALLRRREEQIVRTRAVGARLAGYITQHAPVARCGMPNAAGLGVTGDMPDSIARKRGLVSPDEKLDAAWDDARIVQVLCRDILDRAERAVKGHAGSRQGGSRAREPRAKARAGVRSGASRGMASPLAGEREACVVH